MSIKSTLNNTNHVSKNKYKKENSFLRSTMSKFMGYGKNENKITFYGNKYKTDKIFQHHYDEYYDMYINKFYNREGSMIEIGVEKGKSLQMWLKVFEKAHIYGADIGMKYSGKRHDVFQVDQSSEVELDGFIDVINKDNIMFIIDDGSHIPEHQLLTFNKLFPLLIEGGVYIIEDIETSYWTKQGLYGYKTRYGYKHKKSIIEIFKDIVDVVNKEFVKHNIVTPVNHLSSIHSITFGRNCIIINKRKISDRVYRFKKYL